MSFFLLVLFTSFIPWLVKASDGFPDDYAIPLSGTASVTHYDLPLDYVAACGCTSKANKYPVAALSRMAFGSSYGYGPGCGRCFRVTLTQPVVADPPFIVPEGSRPSSVFKIVDCIYFYFDPCPSPDLCMATEEKTNSVNETIHFDVFSPSPAIPLSWFPSDFDTYKYTDFGAWYADYESVSCTAWDGYTNSDANGVSPTFAESSTGCCPNDPVADNQICLPQAEAPVSNPVGATSTSSAFSVYNQITLPAIPIFVIAFALSWIL